MVEGKGAFAQMGVPDCRTLALKQSPVRFCASVNGIASAGLRLMDIAHNFGNCYKESKPESYCIPNTLISATPRIKDALGV